MAAQEAEAESAATDSEIASVRRQLARAQAAFAQQQADAADAAAEEAAANALEAAPEPAAATPFAPDASQMPDGESVSPGATGRLQVGSVRLLHARRPPLAQEGDRGWGPGRGLDPFRPSSGSSPSICLDAASFV